LAQTRQTAYYFNESGRLKIEKNRSG